jgi:hypothetical protein
MKKVIAIISCLALVACTTRPDTGLAPPVQIPPLPEKLAQRAGPLPSSEDTTMGGQVLDNTRNIRAYNAAAYQVNDLIDLYNCVREAINNKKEIKCL